MCSYGQWLKPRDTNHNHDGVCAIYAIDTAKDPCLILRTVHKFKDEPILL